jgi:Carboxypeptidase regulatory-like domain
MNHMSLLFSLALLSGPVLFGQAAAINGQIVGTVTDPSGAPMANAKVRSLNTATGYEQKTETSSAGLYRFNLMPLGAYEVVVEAPGFTPVKSTGIQLSAGATATVDIALQLKSVATEIVVTSAAPVVDPGKTDQGSSLSANAIANLPLLSRNPYNFILQQPNVSGRGNTEFGVPRKLNANGFNGRINYQLDGSNNVQSDRAGIRLMPISNTWVQEVQQVSNGFAPEFGNTVGTVFNSITKSGANDLHGEGGYIFRRTPFSARPALLAFDRPTPEVNVDSVFADAGGRIVKDKVFFFGAFEHVKRDLPAPVTVPAATIASLGLPSTFADAIPFRQNVYFYMAKMDWQINNSNRLSVRFNNHRNDSPYNSSNIGGLYLVDRTYNFVDRSYAGAVQLVSVLSPRAVNEVRVQLPYRSQQQVRFEATGTGPAITIPGIANFGSSLDAGFVYEELTPEVSENFSLNLNTHALKFGVNIRSIRDTQVQATSANYTFPNVTAYLAAKAGTNTKGYSSFVQTVGEPSISYNSLFTSLYGQDNWKPRPNITLTYGIRYDLYRPPDANASSPFTYSKSFHTDKNNVGPRLGIAVGKGKTVVRASGGIFYDPFQTDTYRKAILNNGTPIFFSVSTAPTTAYAPAFPSVFNGIPTGFNLPPQDITTVSPDFSTLYSANANVSISRELAPNLGLTATYLYTNGTGLPIFRNINLVPTGQSLADGRAIFGSARIFPGFANILSGESVGKSVYNGLNVTLTKRFAHGFEAFATYTWSHAIDDAPEQNNIDSGAFLLSDPANRRRDRGNSLTDRRHAFNANAVMTPVIHTDSRVLNYIVNQNLFAFTLVVQTGEVFNMGSNRVLNGDSSTGSAYQRPLFIGRNTLRAPRSAEFNLRYSRQFPIKERLKAEFFAESTNLFNHTNVTAINATATVDAAGAITAPANQQWTGALDQRLIQFGIRASF